MQIQISKGLFKDKLPNVVLDQVYFESFYDKGFNEVSLDLIYQIPATWSTVSPYRVMLILSHNDSLIHRFRKHPATAKHAILDDSDESDTYMKIYLPGDESGEVSAFPDVMSLGPKSPGALVQKRVRVDLPKLPQDLWPNLYLYAIAYRTNPQDETPSGISQKLRTIHIGMPLAETLYMANRPSTAAVVYTLAESVAGYGVRGDAWYGPVHRHSRGLMAGEAHHDGPHPYVAITAVSNQKTQDKSFMKEQGRLFLHLSNAARSLNRRITQNIEVARNLTGPGSNGISDIHFTRTVQGVLKGVFSINYKQFVQANTKLNFLFTNKKALNSCFEVENLRLFRTRVHSNVASNKLTPGILNICGAGKQGTPKLVATLQNNTINGLNYQNKAVEVTTYVGTDVEMAGIEGGVYEYTLYIDGVDNSVAAVNHVLGLLKGALTAYDGWLSKSFYGQNGALSEDASRRIRSQSTFLQQDGAWTNLIDTYLSAVMFIFGAEAFQGYSLTSWRKNLLAMCNPRNGDLDSMGEVGELVRSFYTSLSHAANPPTMGANSNQFSVRSHMGTTSPASRRISVENVFPSPYDHRYEPTTGFDFLDDRLTQASPDLTGLSYTNYNLRMGNEVGKFNIQPGGSNVAGFLTPARIRTPTNIIDTSNLAVGLNNTIDLFAAKKRPQTPKLSFHTSTAIGGDGNLGSQADVQELLSIGGLSAQPLKLDIQTIRDLPTPTSAQAAELNLVPSSDFLSSGSHFSSDDAERLANISGSAEQILHYSSEHINERSVGMLNSGLVMTLVNSQIANFSQTPGAVSVAGIAGSLAARALTRNPLLIQENNAASIAINLNSIRQVQYFQGFETNPSGDSLIDRPRWSILTLEALELARNSGAPLLCRIQETPDVTSGGNSLALGEYDNLFILGDATSTSISRSYTPYVVYYKLLMNSLQTTAKQIALNISTPMSNVKPFLIRVPLMSAPTNSNKDIVNGKEKST
jgi:hypothetical protein